MSDNRDTDQAQSARPPREPAAKAAHFKNGAAADAELYQAPQAQPPPHDVYAELIVLGLLMRGGDAALLAGTGELLEGDFFSIANGITYRAIKRTIDTGGEADPLTVHNRMSLAEREQIGSVVDLQAAVTHANGCGSTVARAAGIVRKKSIERRMLALLDQASADLSRMPVLLPQMTALAEPLPTMPAWVEQMRNWVPPTDLATRRVAVQWAVEGWIQCARVGALVSAGGTGKTTMLLNLAICHALGRRFNDCPVKRGSFVLLSRDDAQDDLDGALAKMVQAMRLTVIEAETVAAKVRVMSLQGVPGAYPFTRPAQGGAIETTNIEELVCQSLEGISDLVGTSFDTLRQWSGGATNDEQVMTATIAACNRVAQRTGAYVIVPHHTGKQSYREEITDMYCGSGSAAIADNCRFILLLQTATWKDIELQVQRTGQERGDPLVLRSTRGSLLVKSPPPVFMCRHGFEIAHIAGAVRSREQQFDERDRGVLRAVRDGCQTKRAILRRVKGKTADQNARIDDLEARGLIANDSQSDSPNARKFTLSSKGAAWLEYEIQ